MRKYVFSILTSNWSELKITEANNIEDALQCVSDEYHEYEIHSIYSEEIK